MKIYDYEPKNFEKVKEILRYTQSSHKIGTKERIVFNQTLRRFEHHDTYETISNQFTYKFVHDAIKEYPMSSLFKDEAVISSKELIEEDENDMEEGIEEMSVEENANNTLSIITEMSEKINQENRKKIMDVIGAVFKMDVVSEADILKTILEHQEYRKLLSFVLASLNVSISVTKASYEEGVSTSHLRFSKQAEYNISDYKKGVLQAETNIANIRSANNRITELELQIKEKSNIIDTKENAIKELNQTIDNLNQQVENTRNIYPVTPIQYVISYTDKGRTNYIYIDKEVKVSANGTYSVKAIKSTKFINKATKFSSIDAREQIARIIKFYKTVSFVDIADLGPKELVSFFSIFRILVEKMETE